MAVLAMDSPGEVGVSGLAGAGTTPGPARLWASAVSTPGAAFGELEADAERRPVFIIAADEPAQLDITFLLVTAGLTILSLADIVYSSQIIIAQ